MQSRSEPSPRHDDQEIKDRRNAKQQMRDERKALWDNCCAYCGIRPHPKFLTIDHVIPKSQLPREFADMPMNLVPSCEKCNSEKDDIDAFTWYRRQAFYTAERWAKIKG
jgi:5-methylcytosine-specific restriction endonuclease McrA